MDWSAPLSALFPSVQGAVLYALWRRPVPMTGRQVHRVADTGSYTGALLALGRLVDQGLVDARSAGQATEYTLNTEHVLYRAVDAALGSFNPHADLVRRIRALVEERLSDRASDVSLAYFGSFARGEAHVGSDIDVLLVLPDALSQGDEDDLVEALERRGQRWTGNPVQVYATRRKALERAVQEQDPIVDRWDAEAKTVLGPDVRRLLRSLR